MLLVSNLANAYFVKKYSFYRQRDRDMSSTMQSMSRREGPFLVIMGDSLTNNANYPSQICGYRTINMGLDGAKASRFIQYAEQQLSSSNLHPSLCLCPWC